MLGDDGRGALAVFRLVIGRAEIPGRWVCIGREFVPAESVADRRR